VAQRKRFGVWPRETGAVATTPEPIRGPDRESADRTAGADMPDLRALAAKVITAEALLERARAELSDAISRMAEE
jgi:hypothetical protein